MTKRLLLRLCFVLLPCLLIFSACNKNKQEVEIVPYFVSDLQMDIQVEADRPVTAGFTIETATLEGLEINPNIYRDGKLVAQTRYVSSTEDFNNRTVSFKHTGLGMSCGIILSYKELEYMLA